MKINITTKDLTPDEQQEINEAAQIAEKLLNSDEFRNWCINHSYERVTITGRLWWKKYHYQKVFGFHYTTDTGKQVYDKIMAGAEVLDPIPDGEADIWVTVDRRNSTRIVGYTYPNSKWQWIYKWVFRSWGPKDVAGNLIHEWCHKLGYDHEYKFTNNREFSVPYSVGYYVSSKG